MTIKDAKKQKPLSNTVITEGVFSSLINSKQSTMKEIHHLSFSIHPYLSGFFFSIVC
jgi:hypothetical protein